jgi:undecaprenyl pyrophosphate synthase
MRREVESGAGAAGATPVFARRLPRHVGFIPDGNRRWALARDRPRRAGYADALNT